MTLELSLSNLIKDKNTKRKERNRTMHGRIIKQSKIMKIHGVERKAMREKKKVKEMTILVIVSTFFINF